MSDSQPDNNDNDAINTLISISGTLAGIGLALVGILAAKNAISKTQTVADNLFLFSSFGFLVVLTMGYVARKERNGCRIQHTVQVAEWIFAISLILLLLASGVLVYTEI